MRGAALMDALLGPRFRGLPEDTRRRARLVASTNVILAMAVWGGLVFTVVGWPAMFWPTIAGGILLSVNLWVLRTTAWIDRCAMATVLILSVLAILPTWMAGGGESRLLGWLTLVGVLAPMFVGTTASIPVLAALVATPIALYVAMRAGHVFPPEQATPTAVFVNQLFMILVVGALAWILDRSRREALATRDAALASLADAREARLALVENVDAMVFSVDREVRLIAGNSRFDLATRATGHAPILPGQPALAALDEPDRSDLEALSARAFAGEQFAVERTLVTPSQTFEVEILLNPIRKASGEVHGVAWFARDISARLRAQELLATTQRALANAAHVAGKAEVATDVLHNVGNVLASLDVTAHLIDERLQAGRVSMLRRALAELPAAAPADEEKGAQVRAYLGLLAEELEGQHSEMTGDMLTIGRQLDLLKSVIARQQAYAHRAQLVEAVHLDEVIADAVRIKEASLARHEIAVTVEVARMDPVLLDRHKLVEILTSFIANSRQALVDSSTRPKRIMIRAERNAAGNLQIDVADNGAGIAADQLERLFTYGFTTKRGGHGFGLAGSLLTARSMDGTAWASSDGPGRGATFTIELPFRTPEAGASHERAA